LGTLPTALDRLAQQIVSGNRSVLSDLTGKVRVELSQLRGVGVFAADADLSVVDITLDALDRALAVAP
jgi:hypothetical protein